jgi:hypothetical protein
MKYLAIAFVGLLPQGSQGEDSGNRSGGTGATLPQSEVILAGSA